MEEAVAQKRFIVWDGGRNQCTIYNPQTNESFTVSKADFLNLNIPGIKPGMVLIGEEAHHRARNLVSKSHVFEFSELEHLRKVAEVMGVQMFMSNQDVSHLARAYANNDSTEGYKVKNNSGDAHDCACFAQYLLEQPHLSVDQLREFVPVRTEEHQASTEFIHKHRQSMNDDILPAKKQGYYWTPTDGFYITNGITKFIEWVKPKLISLLSEKQQQMLGIKVVYKGKPNQRIDVNLSRLYPLAATLVTSEDKPRVRGDNNQLPFWQFVADNLLGIRASHSKAGVAAASYKHDMRPNVSGFKPTPTAERPKPKAFVKLSCWVEKERRDELRSARSSVDKQVRDIWRTLRSLAVEYYQLERA